MEFTVENIQLVLSQRIPPAWADREPPREIDTASKLDMKATRELRKLLLLKERTALRIINGAENKVWITEAQRFRMKLTNSPACTLCGTHDDTHTLVDTVCPVSIAVKLQWQMAASQPAAQAEWTWRLLVSTEDEMTAPSEEIARDVARRRAAIWTTKWTASKRGSPTPLFPGWSDALPEATKAQWRHRTVTTMKDLIALPKTERRRTPAGSTRPVPPPPRPSLSLPPRLVFPQLRRPLHIPPRYHQQLPPESIWTAALPPDLGLDVPLGEYEEDIYQESID